MKNRIYILGAGMTGLSAGVISGIPIFEAGEYPGGICSSYYMLPYSKDRLHEKPEDGEVYRFEIGWGHWIFGSEGLIQKFIRNFVSLKSYQRKSSVYFPDKDLFVPYPIQNHLRYLGKEITSKAVYEILDSLNKSKNFATLSEWLEVNFVKTLCELFFYPFHKLYTTDLCTYIASQDHMRSPVNVKDIIQGKFSDVSPAGYNTTFVYPEEGLEVLARRMAERCNVNYGKKVIKIDTKEKTLYFEDGSHVGYDILISTIPLNKVIELANFSSELQSKSEPYASVLVVNIGGKKGENCPKDHWIYIPYSKTGFHRVGFYSNVDKSFVPKSVQDLDKHVSIYVEKAYIGGEKPSEEEVSELVKDIIEELIDWVWINEVEVVDPTWIDVAYTWSWVGSNWKTEAIKLLEMYGIYQVGRYGRWHFQGIADSIKEGFIAGSILKGLTL
ncbi:MAG: FAD-dependent oxidoreductase [Candidatus Aenigmatarchaeota archaeon]